MSLPIRIAVLGYGFAGSIFHSPFIAAVPGLELSAIMQRHGDTAAADYPNACILRSVEEALHDPAIDLVVVATPNEAHFELAKAALRAGKHVVVDKPFATAWKWPCDRVAKNAPSLWTFIIDFRGVN